MKRLSTCILLLTMAICASGQTLTGKVTDEQQQPLSYANVVFLSLPDSAFVAGAGGGGGGSFSLSAEGGEGGVKGSCIGFTTFYLFLLYISQPPRPGMISYAVFFFLKKKKNKPNDCN